MSFSSWTITGYGVRISDIKNEVSLVNLMKLIQTAPDLYAKVRKFIDEECNGQIMETYDILTTYVENYGVSNYGGIADILSEVINEVEHIEFSVAEDADDNLYLILPPTYPWEHRDLSEQEKNLTEEETAKILSKYIRVITTDVLDIKFWSISNFSQEADSINEERSVCDDCERGDAWECQFCCDKCYEDYGECPNPDCDPMDIQKMGHHGTVKPVGKIVETKDANQ